MATKRRSDVDVPLFREDAVIHTTRDIRTVGEMLVDVDHLARDLLMDVDGDDAAALLRTWPTVAAAADSLWNALPRHVLDAASDSQMDRIAALNATISSSLEAGWPGQGATDARMMQIARTLSSAAKLVDRYSGEIPLERPAVRQDVVAARARTVQGLYFATHAVSVALHQHGRDRYFDAQDAGERIALSATQTPYAVAPTSRWIQRIQSCERLAGTYLNGRLLRDLGGEANRPSDDPGRLQRAFAVWDIRAHRALASNPTPGNLLLVTRTQGMIAGAGLIFLDAAIKGYQLPSPESLERLVPVISETGQAWSNLGSRWGDLTTPTSGTDADLMRAAAEVRAACRELTHHNTTLASLDQIALHPGLARAAESFLQSLDASADLAHVINEQAARDDLVGPARALSRRAHNDVEDGVFVQENPGSDTVWVSPADIHARRQVALPEPVAAALRDGSAKLVRLTGRAAAVADAVTGSLVTAPDARDSGVSLATEHRSGWRSPRTPASAGPRL